MLCKLLSWKVNHSSVPYLQSSSMMLQFLQCTGGSCPTCSVGLNFWGSEHQMSVCAAVVVFEGWLAEDIIEQEGSLVDERLQDGHFDWQHLGPLTHVRLPHTNRTHCHNHQADLATVPRSQNAPKCQKQLQELPQVKTRCSAIAERPRCRVRYSYRQK